MFRQILLRGGRMGPAAVLIALVGWAQTPAADGVLYDAASETASPGGAVEQAEPFPTGNGAPRPPDPLPFDAQEAIRAPSQAYVPSPSPVSPPAPLPADQGTLDPFSYHMPGSGGDFVPHLHGTVPPGIEVMGILVPEGNAAVAALRIPGQQTLVFVRQGDVIGVQGHPGAATRIGASAARGGEETLYIEIGAIDDQQVELYPVTNPENIRIVR